MDIKHFLIILFLIFLLPSLILTKQNLNNIINRNNNDIKKTINKNIEPGANEVQNDKEKRKNNIIFDDFYIDNYKGEELETEWNWVKNISIVYTWVDGSDINFLDIKAKYDYGYRKNSSRYRSADELKYSIRSIEQYMPWFNGTIYIVTCKQIPKWLDLSNPRIKIIDHQIILPQYIYPTFDSNIIELFLDKIPGITEKFIYFNDDIFLNNYIHPSFFFTNKSFYPKIHRNNNKLNVNKKIVFNYISNNIKPFVGISYFTQELVKEYFDKNFIYFFKCHSPFILYRDLFETFRQLFKEDLKSRCAYRFRGPYKIQTLYLYQTFMEYATKNVDFPLKLGGNGKAKQFNGEHFNIEKSKVKYSTKLVEGSISDKYIIYGKFVNDDNENKNCINKIINNPNILIFNINDSYTKNSVFYDLTQFLIKRFPHPSSFEKQKYINLEKYTYSKLIKVNNFSNEIIKGLPKQYDDLKIKYFNDVIKENNYLILKKYFKDLRQLSKPLKYISDREKKEIKNILSYNGGKLEKKWEWVKSISIVYILENGKKESKEIEFNELKYSLRSVVKYLPWFKGNIYIITQKKIQNELAWLKKDNNKLKIINQSDILPNVINTANNKHFIELYFDKIPNITEKFIYMNNNHYFKQYTHPQFFFNDKFYPKYNFKLPLSKKQEELIKEKNTSFYNTYSIIKDYFGKYYVKYMYLKEAPYSLYRDLFEPVRQLYKEYLNKWFINQKKIDILPIYLVSTYNIYGTEQPYFPDYVVGFGKIMNSKPPVLNNNRTISYYGFDITSNEISKNTMLFEIKVLNKINTKNIKVIMNSKKIFFSLIIMNKNVLSNNDKYLISKMFNDLYSKKCSLEI